MSKEQLNSNMAKLGIEPKMENYDQLEKYGEVIARKSKRGSPASNSEYRVSSTLSAHAKLEVIARKSKKGSSASNSEAGGSSTLSAHATKIVSSNAKFIQSVSLEGNDDDDDEDPIEDSDFDSDVSERSYDTRKNHKLLKVFFKALDSLTEKQFNAPDRKWQCPACHVRPGPFHRWYNGLSALVCHAKTIVKRRAKLHREFAELLEEEVRRRGESKLPFIKTCGKWRSLPEKAGAEDVIWPPMVMVRNTVLRKVRHKTIGIGVQELVDHFKNYGVVRARNSYGPDGHRGMSVLIFEPSPLGCIEAECLHKHFADEGRGREAWLGDTGLLYPDGSRILYGYMAKKEDLEDFNHESEGISHLEYEIKSYYEMVVNLKLKVDEDNQKLKRCVNRVVQQQKLGQIPEKSLDRAVQKLKGTLEDDDIVRLNNEERYRRETEFVKNRKLHPKVKQRIEKHSLEKAYDARLKHLKLKHRMEKRSLENMYDVELADLMLKHTPSTSSSF